MISLNVEEIDSIPDAVVKELQAAVDKYLNRAFVYYRLFARKKDSHTVAEKINIKRYGMVDEKGVINPKKLQDLFGVRIVLYFQDDIEACLQIIKKILR